MTVNPPAASELAIHSTRVVTPAGELDATVIVRDGVISQVLKGGPLSHHAAIQDVGDLAISPGVVDTHVHVNEPGRTTWEGFETATRAAVVGGVTTIVDMPLNSHPVTTTVAALRQKLSAARGKCACDVGFYGGLTGNLAHLATLLDSGVLAIKAFLCPSGLDEFPAALDSELQAAMRLLAEREAPLLVHCELPVAPVDMVNDQQSYRQYLNSRPEQWEVDAIAKMIGLCRQSGCHVHIVHLSAGDSLPLISAAKEEGLPLTVETCPHYLYFSAESIPDGDTRFKCAPPIRSRLHRDQLWDALQAGMIDTVGSDHSPCLPELKRMKDGDFRNAWGGIASIQWLLSATWTAARQRGVRLTQLAHWLSENPAKLVGLSHSKGRIEPGRDADLVVWDPERTFEVQAEDIRHRHPTTPYLGCELLGTIHQVYLRGQLAFDRDRIVTTRPGQLLLRPKSQTESGRRSHDVRPPYARAATSCSEYLNALRAVKLETELQRCCASPRWVAQMAARRPFPDDPSVGSRAEEIWWSLDERAWRAAFAAHPRIGDLESLREKFSDGCHWARNEQAGTQVASDATLQRLADANQAYESKFGYLFIVCATGKSAEEMLDLLMKRLKNLPAEEIRVAASEQLKITQLRLQKLGS